MLVIKSLLLLLLPVQTSLLYAFLCVFVTKYFFLFLNQSLNSRKAMLPRVTSEDSLSLEEYCSNCLFMSSLLNSEVWKKNPTEFGELIHLFVVWQSVQNRVLCWPLFFFFQNLTEIKILNDFSLATVLEPKCSYCVMAQYKLLNFLFFA